MGQYRDSYFERLRSMGLKESQNERMIFLRKNNEVTVFDKGIQRLAKKVRDLGKLEIPEDKERLSH